MAKRVFKSGCSAGVVIGTYTLSPDNNELSCAFENLSIDLQAPTDGLATAKHFTFHANTEVDDARPDVKVDVRYSVVKSPCSIAKLSILGAESLKSEDFLFGSSMNEQQRFLSFICAGRSEAVGAPFVFTVIVAAQRTTTKELVQIQIDAIDISVPE